MKQSKESGFSRDSVIRLFQILIWLPTLVTSSICLLNRDPQMYNYVKASASGAFFLHLASFLFERSAQRIEMLLVAAGYVAGGIVPLETPSWHDLTVIDPYLSTTVFLATAIVAVGYNAFVESFEECTAPLRERGWKTSLRPQFRRPSFSGHMPNIHIRRGMTAAEAGAEAAAEEGSS